MEQDRRVQALKAAIREGIESGVSDKTVPEIMEDVETRLRADGKLNSDAVSREVPKKGEAWP